MKKEDEKGGKRRRKKEKRRSCIPKFHPSVGLVCETPFQEQRYSSFYPVFL
jgi:hypothetical protein